jgi:hypothetical protein
MTTGRLAGYGHRAPRIARRRAVVYSALLGVSAILMLASATAPVAELQRGLAFALAPFAEGVNGVGREVRSAVEAAAEIDRLRREKPRPRGTDRLSSTTGPLTLVVENESPPRPRSATRRVPRWGARELADVNRVTIGGSERLAIVDVVIGAARWLVA